jgi:hypothetical protein
LALRGFGWRKSSSASDAPTTPCELLTKGWTFPLANAQGLALKGFLLSAQNKMAEAATFSIKPSPPMALSAMPGLDADW